MIVASLCAHHGVPIEKYFNLYLHIIPILKANGTFDKRTPPERIMKQQVTKKQKKGAEIDYTKQ